MLDLIPFTGAEAKTHVFPLIQEWANAWFNQNKHQVKPVWRQELRTWLLRNRFLAEVIVDHTSLHLYVRSLETCVLVIKC